MTPLYQQIWRRENRKEYNAICLRSHHKNREKRLEKKREYNNKNRESINAKNREYKREKYAKKKEKELRVYYTKLKYERKNPGRGKKYYYENRDAILVQKKIYRESKRLGKSQYTESPQTEKLRHILGKG